MRTSIVIPSYNQGRFIGDAIRSIIAQGHSDAEIIVIDGGSFDDTVEVVESFGSQISHFVSEPDRGQSHALNKGFAAATGDVLAWLCSDDVYLPGAFDRAIKFFSEDESREFLYGDGYIIDETGEKIREIKSGPVLDRKNFHNYNYVFSTTAFWRRSLWERAGGHIDETNNWTMDWELFIRMNMHAELHYRSGHVACLRHHEATKTGIGTRDQRALRNREIAAVSRKYGGALCYNSLMHPLLRLADTADRFSTLPWPLNSLMFRTVHLPLRLMPGERHSIFFNGKRNRS